PIEGEPADVVAIVAASADWLSTGGVPKLFFRAEPGAILANDEDLAFIRRLPALTEVKVAGRHYVQEDSPDEIGRAIAGWMGTLGGRRAMQRHDCMASWDTLGAVAAGWGAALIACRQRRSRSRSSASDSRR